MRLTYDETADALYIYVREGQKVARTEMIDGGTLVDVDASGDLIGIEVLAPARDWPLDEIMERFAFEPVAALMLRTLWGRGKQYPFGSRTGDVARSTSGDVLISA